MYIDYKNRLFTHNTRTRVSLVYIFMNEKLIERKLREGVKRKGGIALKLYSAYHTGLPDRLILMPEGRASFAELKTTGKKPTPLQEKAISELREMGFMAEVIDTQEKLDRFIDEL